MSPANRRRVLRSLGFVLPLFFLASCGSIKLTGDAIGESLDAWRSGGKPNQSEEKPGVSLEPPEKPRHHPEPPQVICLEDVWVECSVMNLPAHPDLEHFAELRKKWEQWEAGVHEYTFVRSRSCYCGGGMKHLKIWVEGGEITNVVEIDPESGEVLDRQPEVHGDLRLGTEMARFLQDVETHPLGEFSIDFELPTAVGNLGEIVFRADPVKMMADEEHTTFFESIEVLRYRPDR